MSGTPVKDELARKKEKLEEMRRKKMEIQKMNAEKQKAKLRSALGDKTEVGGGSSERWSNADDIFKEFDIGGVPPQSTDATTGSSALNKSNSSVSLSSSLNNSSTGVGQPDSSSAPDESALSMSRKPTKLEMGTFNTVDIAPVESYLYPKSTQTDELLMPKELQPPSNETDENQVIKEDTSTNEEKEQQKATARSESPVPIVKEMSEEEKNSIINSEQFLCFLTKSAQLVERTIATEPDVYKSYVQEDDKTLSVQPGSEVKVSRMFYQDFWCSNSAVSSLDWSPFFPNELFLSSYHSFNNDYHADAIGSSSTGGPDNSGLVLVWNLAFNTETPDSIYQCQSSVVNAVFAKFHQNLVIGGTYSGHVVIWDSRVNKRSPVHRTTMPTQGHTFPVFCTEVIGTENAHNLITISSDGKLCSWSLDMLSEPQETVELFTAMGKAQSTKNNVPVKCMSFPTNEYNSFVVGGEDGYLYGAVRHGSKPGITDTYEKHFAPVTSVDFNHCPGPVDFSHLFISSSFDWSAKLWSTKTPGRALHSLEGLGEYVTESRWCPTHPATFATTLTTGKMDIWNLNHDTEVPLSSLQLESSPAIVKAKWAANGKQIVLGDDDGRVHVVDVGENIFTPQQDAWTHLVHTLTELQNETTEIDQWSDTGSL